MTITLDDVRAGRLIENGHMNYGPNGSNGSMNVTPISPGCRQTTLTRIRSRITPSTNSSGIPKTLYTLSRAPSLDRSTKAHSIGFANSGYIRADPNDGRLSDPSKLFIQPHSARTAPTACNRQFVSTQLRLHARFLSGARFGRATISFVLQRVNIIVVGIGAAA